MQLVTPADACDILHTQFILANKALKLDIIDGPLYGIWGKAGLDQLPFVHQERKVVCGGRSYQVQIVM